MNPIKTIIILIFSLLISSKAFSTAQIPDILIEGKDTLWLFANPLFPYHEQNPSLEFHELIGCGSTACWRGYQAFWKLENDSLFLTKIRSCHQECGREIQDANLEKMFPTKYKNQEVFADWLNETIMSPSGALVEYIHLGYASKYQYETYFKFEKGILKKRTRKTNIKLHKKIIRELKEIELAKITLDTIFHHIKTNLDWNKVGDDLMCDEEYILKFNRKGKIRKVILKPIWDSKRENWLDNFYERRCRRKIKKALKKLKLNYLDRGFKGKFEIPIDIFYDDEKQKLELWKPMEWDYDY